MFFVVEFKVTGELSGKPLNSLFSLNAETLPLAVREVQKSVADGVADEAILYVPMRIFKGGRRVDILEAHSGRQVAIDSPAAFPMATDNTQPRIDRPGDTTGHE
jgi:hypothetical protein